MSCLLLIPVPHRLLKPPVRLALLLLTFVTGALLLSLAQNQPAHAQVTNFDYNFETLVNNQLLFGQDQWVTGAPGIGNIFVRTGLDGNQTHTAAGDGGSSGTFATRPLDNAFYYTTQDTNVVLRLWGYVPSGGNNHTASGGIAPIVFGPHELGGLTPLTTYLDAPRLFGDLLLHDRWYEYRVTVDFSIYGGLATLSYRDVTGGATTFTVDSVIHNVNLGLVPDNSGRYGFSQIFIRNDGAGYIDNLHFDAPTSTPKATSSTGEYCIFGDSTGVGWDWKVDYLTSSGVNSFMGSVPPGSVASPFHARDIAEAWSLNLTGSNNAGLSASHVASSDCFKVILDTAATGAVSPFAYFVSVRTSGGPWCLITNHLPPGCSFNPTVFYVAPVGGTATLSVSDPGSPFPWTPMAAIAASAMALLAVGGWYGRRRWLR